MRKIENNKTVNPSQIENRAFQRHAVNIKAVCLLPDLEECPCEIRNVCIGGMYFMYDQGYRTYTNKITVGTIIELLFSVPASDSIKKLSFQGRIVRPDESGAGIALLNPCLSSLQTLNEYVKTLCANSDPEKQITEEPSPYDKSTPNKNLDEILTSCKNIIDKSLKPLITISQEHIVDALFKGSEKAKDSNEQNAYFDSLNILNHSKNKLQETFCSSVLAQLNAYCADPNSINKCAENKSKKGKLTLTLIEEDVLEDWIAVTEISNVTRVKHHEILYDIEQHLSTLYQTCITEENNPFGPILFAQAFEDGIQQLQLHHLANQLCYTTFKKTLTMSLGDLYKEILQQLLEFEPLYKESAHEATVPPTADAVIPSLDNTTHETTVPSTTTADATTPLLEPEQAQKSAINSTPKGISNEGVPPPLSPTPQVHASHQDIYQVVQTLRSLQQQPNTPAQHSNTVQSQNNRIEPQSATQIKPSKISAAYQTENSVTRAPVMYKQTEVLDALTHLQERVSTQPTTSYIEQESIYTQVSNILSEDNGEQSNKIISDRENGIIEVGGQLFSSLFRDRLVSSNVRAWLKRLEIPILKLAIVDNSIFTDKSHVARQVINKISQLELYGEDNPITTRVNHLLDQIVNTKGDTSGVFKKTLHEIDQLIQVQNKAYTKNLEELVTECEEKEAHMQGKKTNNETIDPQLQEWVKQAHRIKIGSWLLFSLNSNTPLRLRLAWTAKDKTQYVFVNLRGIQEYSLSITEIAQQLRNGTTIALDNANDPAMDRAQYQMLQDMHLQLLHEATHDQLTGLINRREFESCLQEAFSTAQQTKTQHVLYYLDLGHLNVINTTCGYDAGDKLLIEVTTLLQEKTPKNATFARIGDNEFSILLIDSSLDEALNIAEQQKEAIQNYRLSWEDKRLSITISIGMVEITGKETHSVTLLQAAESSCKAAKRKDSNSIHIFNHNDTELSSRQKTLEWVSRIDQALDENTLELRCQLIKRIQDDSTLPSHHSEILLSVTDEQGNAVSPQEFILAAEEYHRMPKIDRWVVRNVFNWIVQHDSELESMGSLAINLSGKSLNDDTFLSFVLNEIKKTKVPTHKVCFEITETAGIANLSNAIEFIEEIKKTGCQFSLDDFGSGLSSYGYLKNLPIDYLKIDGSFVKYMNNNPCDYAVVKSITEIGHFMGKKIIAECVENDVVLGLLQEIGVDYAQGYGIEKPCKLKDFTKVKSSEETN